MNVVDSMDDVTYLEGRTRFISPNQVEVRGEVIEGDKFIIATGFFHKVAARTRHRRIRLPTNITALGH